MNESNISGKIKRKKGQRGPDREHREFNPKSLSNLKQFQKPVSEANLSVNSGINWTMMSVIVVFVVTVGLVIWRIRNRKRND